MASTQNNIFREGQDQHAITSETSVNKKRASKSRSKVWEKVVWFTSKAKGGKDNKANSETFASSSEGRKNVYCLCVENNGHHKTNPKVRKVRSFNYLKRRKVRQFGDQLNSVAVVEEASVQDCGTATGTFHDFQSERRISRHERLATTSNNNLVSEMARGVNLPQCEVKENVKSVLSLPLHDLSLHEGCAGLCTSPSFPTVRRSVSFSGPAYNSWPRRKPRIKKNDEECPRRFIATGPIFSEENIPKKEEILLTCTSKLEAKSVNAKVENNLACDICCPVLGPSILLKSDCSSGSVEPIGEHSSICFTASPDNSTDELVKEKTTAPCLPELQEEEAKSLTFSNESNPTNDINCLDLGSNALHEGELVKRNSNGSVEPMDIPEYYPEVPDFQTNKHILDSPDILQDDSSPIKTPSISLDDTKIDPGFIVVQCDAPKLLPCSSQSVDDSKKVDMTIKSPVACGETLRVRSEHPWQRKQTVNGQQFKKNTEIILQWFREFNDEQKNVLIRQLLEECELPQMHMLSIAMEPILHKSCPPNCQDMLSWLPHHVALHVLSFLDLVSLCCCSQVNRTWNNLASTPLLWQNLCGQPDWQLSRIAEEKEKKRYTLEDGTVQWKKMFASRYLLHQNWLKGKCNVRTFEGHTQGISCVQFDDTRIASGSYDKMIRVWDIKSGDSDVVLTLAGHSGTVRCLTLDGNRLVSGSVDRSIKVWDLSFESYWSGASCKVTMIGHMHTVRCLQVDDEKVVSGSYDKTLKVWDIKTGNCRLTLRGHNAAVLCVQFDDRKIVSGSYDKTIKVWSLAEGSCLMTLTGHHDAVTCLNLAFDSRKVISGSLDHNLKFWDLLNGKCIGTLDWIRSEGHTGVIRCLQTDSWRIVSAGDDKTLKMWSLESGQRLLTLRCHTDGVTCLQFNDYSIVSGSYDKTVKLWDFTPSHEFLTPG